MKVDEQKSFGKRECPSCACLVLKNQNRCPICGYEFPHPGRARKAVPVIAIILLVVLALIWTVL